jgi:cytochrome P450
MDEPRDVLAAPSHPSPYPWYARLRRERPISFDAALGLWVVADAALVREALRHPQLRVRPPAEPVPRALVGTAAGEVFAQLVRMNDGAFHARHRPAVAASAARWGDAAVEAATAAATRDLAARLDGNAFLSALPVQAMARLLGVDAAQLDATVDAVQNFVPGVAAGATPADVDRADAAARWLLAQGEAQGLEPVAAANRIALMQQSLDATAGLVGNAILGCRGVRATLAADPPIHNTRRFAAADLELGGQRIAAGAGLVLLLVDEALAFGEGVHGCPGERVALGIAQCAVATLQSLDALAPFSRHVGYRPLHNARIPVFAQ